MNIPTGKPILHEIHFEKQIDDDVGCLPYMLEQRFAAQCADLGDKAILRAIIQAAQEDGIDVLYLLDRDFILSAIREKIEREREGKEP